MRRAIGIIPYTNRREADRVGIGPHGGIQVLNRGISKAPGIYAIVRVASGKFYIGSAVSLWQRCKDHRAALKRGDHKNDHLQHAWDLYGPRQFVFMPLEIVADKGDLLRVEQEYLDRLTPYESAIGYNLSPTASSVFGLKRPPEFKAASSARQKGKTFSEEHKANISKARTGITVPAFSGEHRAKIAAARKGSKLGRPMNMLTPDQVREIRRRMAAGEDRGAVAARFRVHRNYIRLIERGKRWGWLDREPVTTSGILPLMSV